MNKEQIESIAVMKHLLSQLVVLLQLDHSYFPDDFDFGEVLKSVDKDQITQQAIQDFCDKIKQVDF